MGVAEDGHVGAGLVGNQVPDLHERRAMGIAGIDVVEHERLAEIAVRLNHR